MSIELTGVLGFVFAFCVTLIGVVIILLGSYIVAYHVIWEIMIRHAMKTFGVYKKFVEFIWQSEEFKAWKREKEEH